MIPTSQDYYERRAHEHRNHARTARPEQQRIHNRLAEVYTLLARLHVLSHPVRLRHGPATPGTDE